MYPSRIVRGPTAAGALIMTEPQLYFPHGIIDGIYLVVYNSRMELELKILHYLHPENDQERIRIAHRGRDLVLTHHRTWQQAERLFLNDLEYRNELDFPTNHGNSDCPRYEINDTQQLPTYIQCTECNGFSHTNQIVHRIS